jgi:hypothetical protein
MSPEQAAAVIELAIYRVGDRWRRSDDPNVALIGQALREIGEEITKILADHQRQTG